MRFVRNASRRFRRSRSYLLAPRDAVRSRRTSRRAKTLSSAQEGTASTSTATWLSTMWTATGRHTPNRRHVRRQH